jgi:ABC-type antimicrobial peptide transport system permease subunit
LVISLVCLTACNFIITYESDIKNKNIEGRTLVVYSDEENYDEISNIKHVIFNDSIKYSYGHYSKISELSNEKMTAEIYFLPYIEDMGVDLKDGETICPKKFYPYQLNQINENDEIISKIDYKYMLNSKDIINKTLTIISENSDNDNISVKVVGTYDATKYMNSLKTCYITKSDYDKVMPPYEITGTATYVDGTQTTDYSEYEGNIVIVDSYKNVDEVSEILQTKGYKVIRKFTFDEELLNCYFYIPLFICMIVLIICLNLIYIFLSKKIKYRIKNYGILKSCGYSNKIISKLEIIENSILFVISFIISFIIYIVLFYIIKNTLLIEEVYNNVDISIPYWMFILEIIFIICCIIIFTKNIFKKVLKNKTSNLLNDVS